MIENSIFREPALIGYLVKSLKRRHSDKQVGKTMIQKMVYLLVRRKVMAFKYYVPLWALFFWCFWGIELC